MSQTSQTYDPVAKTMHWLVALLILGLLVSGPIMTGGNHPPEFRKFLFTAHKTMGILVLFLTIFRLFWRHLNPPPPWPKESMPDWQVVAARVVHTSLYLLALFIPLTGWAMTSMGPYGIQLFGVIPFPSFPFFGLIEASRDNHHTLAALHEASATLIAVLVVVHIGATFKHHFVERDDILLRISPACLTGFLNRIRGL